MVSKRYGFLLALVLIVPSARAQTDTAQLDADPIPKTRVFSLTLSPIHLVFPIYEFTGEYAVDPQFGVAGILGAGSITVQNDLDDDVKIPVFEFGGQAMYYALGSFRHGLQLGGEMVYIKISPPKDEGVSIDLNGLTFGPLIGYKFISSFGLTFLAQAGWQFLTAQVKATDESGQEIEGSGSGGFPNLNLNVGWSL
jgi:hypothetical protein